MRVKKKDNISQTHNNNNDIGKKITIINPKAKTKQKKGRWYDVVVKMTAYLCIRREGHVSFQQL